MGKSIGMEIRAAVRDGHIRSLNRLIYTHGLESLPDKGYHLLFKAFRYKRVDVIKALINGGVSVNSNEIPVIGKTPLHCAVSLGNFEITRLLLQYGADIDAYDANGNTPLMTAMRLKKYGIFELLVQYGADLSLRHDDGLRTLTTAAKDGNRKIVEILLRNGADDNPRSLDGEYYSPLYAAANCGHVDIVKLLLKNRPNQQMEVEDYDSKPLRAALSQYTLHHRDQFSGKYLTIINDLLIAGGDRHFETYFHDSLKAGLGEAVKLFLRHGANVHTVDKQGETPLFKAAWSGSRKIFKLLLHHGAFLDQDSLILKMAVERGKTSVVGAILQLDIIDINDLYDVEEFTVLHLAALNCSFDMVKLLIKYGANVNAQDAEGNTALHYLAQCHYLEYEEILTLLLMHGADSKIRNRHGLTPIMFAAGRYSVLILTTKILAAKLNISQEDVYYLKWKCKMDIMPEINNLKNERVIENSQVSFYDLLIMPMRSLLPIFRNENMVKAAVSKDKLNRFPVFRKMLKKNIKRAILRKELHEKCCELFDVLLNDLPELPLNCVEKIIDYLDNSALKRYISACQTELSIDCICID